MMQVNLLHKVDILSTIHERITVKTFKIQWLSGRVEFLKGADITSALLDASHSKAAIRAIKKYEVVLVTEEVDVDRSCSSFAKYLSECITDSSTILTSNRCSKDKRAQRRKRKILDKVY